MLEDDPSFTIELEDDFPDGMLPTLDTKMCMMERESTLKELCNEIAAREEQLSGIATAAEQQVATPNKQQQQQLNSRWGGEPNTRGRGYRGFEP